MTPLISVVMPTYNSEKYVAEAVSSIVGQTFSDFEFLIINEHLSNDKTLEIITRFNDPRIRVIQNTERLGIAESLNVGIRQAAGKYIARMDSDDISCPERLERQFTFMEQNPHISVLGAANKLFGTIDVAQKVLESHDFIKASLLFHCSIWHPTIFFRKSSLMNHELFYDSSFTVEDYELWIRAIDVLQFANLPDVLLYYRVHDHNTVSIRNKVIAKEEQLLYHRLLKKLDIEYEKDYTLGNWLTFSAEHSKLDWRDRLIRLEAFIKFIVRRNSSCNVYDQHALKTCANRYWLGQMDAPDMCLSDDPRLPLELIADIITKQAEAKAPSGDICLYGLGRIGQAALPHFLTHFKERITCISDSSPSKWGQKFCGYECVNPADLPKDITIFVTAGYDAATEIIPHLHSQGHKNVHPYVELALE